MIQRYERHLTNWVSERDRGQAHALNKGFAQASGEIFGFLNSDDLYLPGALQKVAAAYLACRRRRGFWHAFAVEDFDATGPRTIVRPKLENRLADWADNVANLHQPGVFWSRQVYLDIGGFDDSLKFAFDRKFFSIAALKGYRLTIAPDFVSTRFRIHDCSKTTNFTRHDQDGFTPEFIHVSEELKQQASLDQRLRIVFGRLARRQQALGENLLNRNSPGRMARLAELALAAAAYPPLAQRRLYWGALRRNLFGTPTIP